MATKKCIITLATFVMGTLTLTTLWNNLKIRGMTDIFEKIYDKEEVISNTVFTKVCKMPYLPVASSELRQFIHDVPIINCSKAGQDWIKCVGSHCSIQEDVRLRQCQVNCSFTDIVRVNDFKNKVWGKTVKATNYTLRKSDLIRVSCKSKKDAWSSVLTGIRNDSAIWKRSNWNKLPVKALNMNVLMFGLDSISRNSFIRKLPKTYEYLTNVLKGDVLQGYNIVGDGTPQALIPILTGQTELELPDTRKRMRFGKFVNTYPFIWNDFKQFGYVTGYLEDCPGTGVFTYRLKGFNDAPTDHYMRPYYLESASLLKKWPNLCSGEIPRHKVMLNLIKDFFSFYQEKPKFLFGFHGELSHDDYNLVGVADDDIKDFLQDLNESQALNNTILIVMADHGHRFAKIRDTYQGKLEERLPFFSFTFPEWFKEKHVTAYQNFRSNLDRLTTPFDIYATLNSVLNLNDTGTADLGKRSLSLFTKIPAERTCDQADIQPHWCACLDWRHVPPSNPIVNKLSSVLEETLNNITADHRNICHVLTISKVYWTIVMRPNEKVLRYKKASDADGFKPDLSAKFKLSREVYQQKVQMSPGESLFEASVTRILPEDEFQLKLSDISRINLYGKQARCVEKDLPDLRKFCYCKDDARN